MPDPNEVGAIWKQSNERGTQWLRVKVNLERLLELTGGAVGPVTLVAFSRTKTKDEQPDYDLLLSNRRHQQVVAPEPEADVRPNTPSETDTEWDAVPGTMSEARRRAHER